MNVEVQMWHLLECGDTDRVPDTDSLAGKSCRNCPGDLRKCGHEMPSRLLIKFANIGNMRAWNEQGVARVELAQVEKGD